MASGSQNMPKDLQAMTNILKEFGINDYEPSVLNQMLEFTYRYASNVIEDAVLYSNHAKKKSVDAEDVKLAISLQHDRNFACLPSRELTAELARQRNVTPLPTIRSSAGLRLPPDRHSLTACNFNLKPATKKQQRSVHTISRINVPNVAPNSVSRPTPVPKSVPCPIIKFSEGNKVPTQSSVLSPMASTTMISAVNSMGINQLLMPTVGVLNTEVKPSNVENKRPHEDDDYDNNCV